MSTNPDASAGAGPSNPQEMVVVLAADDPDGLRDHVAPLLDREDVTVVPVDDDTAAIQRLEGGDLDCLVASYDPKGGEGMDLLDYLRESETEVPVVLLPSTRTTVIDSRNFVVDVESVVDPETDTEELADSIVETVAERRETVTARRRQQLESGLRQVARDADDAADPEGLAGSVTDRLGGTTGVDGAWVTALAEEGLEVVAAADPDAPVPEDELSAAVQRAVAVDGPDVSTDRASSMAAVPVDAPGGDRWAVSLESAPRFAFTEGETRVMAELRDALERSLAAVDAARRQEASEVQSEAFSRLIEHLDVPVLAYDAGGLVHAASPGFGDLLDRDHAALAGEPVWDVLPEPRLETFDDHWEGFEEGDADNRRMALGGTPRQLVTTRVVLEEDRFNVALAVEADADADTSLAEVLAYELRHWMSVAEESDGDEDVLDSVADRVESAVSSEVQASGSRSELQVTPQPIGQIASEAWAEVLGDAGDSAVQGGTTVLADRTVMFRLFTHLFRTLLTYGDAGAVDVGVHDDGFFVEDDGSGVDHDERAYASATEMTDARRGASVQVARRLADRHDWELTIERNDAGGTRFEVSGVRTPSREVSDAELRDAQLAVLSRVLRHDLRTKLNVVKGNAELIRERLAGEAAEFFSHLERAASDLITVGERAREFEQLESPDQVSPQRVDLAALVDDIVRDVQEEFPEATVSTSVPSETVVETYPDALSIVLSNLLRNAVEHSDQRAPEVRVGVDVTSDGVELGVADDGPGIPDSELSVLSEGDESALDHGSGLGLWVTKWGVQYLGGDITFEDNEPRGTVAVVTIPPRVSASTVPATASSATD